MKSTWITIDSKAENTALYCFEKSFTAKEKSKFDISISADTRYQLYINGKYVCEGPCQGSAFDQFYEEFDASEYLTVGVNNIKVYVMHITDNVFTTTYPRKKPALWFEGNFGESRINSDESWTCDRIDGIKFAQGDFVFYSMPHFEYHSLNVKRERLKTVVLCDTLIELKSCDLYGVMSDYRLSKRTIPLMKTYDKTVFSRRIETENGFILDTGRYTTAKVRVKASGKSGDILKITYGECYKTKESEGVFIKGDRSSTDGVLQGPSDYIELSEESREIEFFWYRSFRFIELSCESKSDLSVETEYYPFFYPLGIQAEFECSNDSYNKMWDVSINTIKCCMHEILVDCPFYEQQQYGMDGYLQSLFIMRLSDDKRMVRKIIDDLSKSQQHDGFLCSNYPARYQQIIPVFSIYWLMMLCDYLKYTNDYEFAEKYLGVVEKLIQGFDNNLTEDGLVGSIYWPYVDWAGNWKIGVPGKGREEPIAVYSMIYSKGLMCAAEIMESFGRYSLSEEYTNRHLEINKAVTEKFRNKDYFNDTLTVEEFSQHTGIWAILSEAVTGEEAKKTAEKIIIEDMVSCSFSMSYFLFRALEKTGMYDKSFKYFSGFLKMLELNCTTWCENPDKPRSECHGWSAVPIYEFSAMVLGVQPTKAGFDEIIINPNLGELSWAKGSVPTPYGLIEIEAEKIGEETLISYRVPSEIKVNTAKGVRVK